MADEDKSIDRLAEKRGPPSQEISPAKGSEPPFDQETEYLREKAARLQAILDTTVDGIIMIDVRTIVQSFNMAAERIFGYAADEVIGRKVSMLMPSPYRENHDAYVANYLRTGNRKIIGIGREVMGRRKDGSTLPLYLAVSEVLIGDRRLFTGILRDVTEKKRAEEELKKARDELEERVKERTARLLAANERLRQEIEVRRLKEEELRILWELSQMTDSCCRQSKLLIEVIDYGCGIPREKREEIFLPFASTKKDGTGLGLAIVKKIIEAHGGQVQILDNPQQRGVIFRVSVSM